jgi:predicted Rossmann fold flavoprotein
MAKRAFDVIIVGAGAAGLMCAIEAGKRRRSVLVIEHNDAPAKKILISGGGHCNFTNLHFSPDNFISENPNFPKSALARYSPADFIALVERHGIRYHEKKLGQLFCDGSARQIVDMLLEQCAAARAEFALNCRIQTLSRNRRFELQTNRGEFECDSLVIATGGLSIPKLGATDFGYAVAKQFGLNLTPVRPGLVPLIIGEVAGGAFQSLQGVSFDSVVRTGAARFQENVLFTHRGLSGPAILQISSYWKPGATIHVDIQPDESAPPLRFRQQWDKVYAPQRSRAQWSRKETEEYERRLHDWTLQPTGTEGYAKAEVTVGGVDTRELSSQTMEARRAPGLHFIGEVVDVTGQLGGYNFQWAWASGYVAGQAV